MIKSIPLNKLVQSPRNVRRHGDQVADAELKASIASHGLLQNLIVRPAARGKFEVEAGERRRRAMLALADDKILARDHEVTCLVLEDSAEAAVETSLAENFHRLAMNPADEAQAFAAIVAGGATVEDVARRFGLTVRFVEGRLRLATLAPVVFEALASGQITLDIAKAFGATSDQEIQARVFEQVSSAYYAPNPDSIRRMVLSGTVRGSDPRARLVGREAYTASGGRVERELFDDDDSESWVDVALLENLAAAKMEEQAKALAAEQGLAWIKPTLDPYASHDLVEGLVRLPAEPAPLTEAELARLDELDASYDEHAAILEDEDSAEEAVAAAEAAIEAIERECQEIRARPPVIAPELKAEAGMVLVLSRDGTPVLQPVFYGERQAEPAEADSGIEVIPADDGSDKRRTTLSKRLVDELAMQRRDVLALHVASDPGLALDVMVFTLADADTHDWRARAATTLRAPLPAGPIIGFEAKDAPASSALAELRSSLDESWRAGIDATSRFDLFRALSDDSRAAWLGYVVARSLEASLNMAGERQLPFQDHLGSLVGIDMAQWWRPTAANYFDRVSKQVILDALTDVGGLELSSRFASVKKGDLAMSAERVFAGTYITEVQVREKALAWVPEVMRFASAAPDSGEPEIEVTNAEPGVDTEHQSPASWPPDLLLTGKATRYPREAVLRLTPEGRFLFGRRAEGARDLVALTGEPIADCPDALIRRTIMAYRKGQSGGLSPATRITQEIIARLEAGTKPWIKPWRGVPVSRPLRACGIPYRGMNVFWLWMVADMCGYASPFWMTYNQAKSLGAQVRKGEKSTIAIFYKSYTKEVEVPDTGEKTDEARRVLKAYPVFNADQVEGLPERFHPAATLELVEPEGREAELDAFFAAIPANLRHQGSEAYYEPTADRVTMPPTSLFSGFDHYYATLAHELSHWTGHASRLGRDLKNRFGTAAYAAEELVAELSSAMLGAELGLPVTHLDSHASYIEHWLKLLKDDDRAILTAAAKAEEASTLLLKLGGRVTPEQFDDASDDAALAA